MLPGLLWLAAAAQLQLQAHWDEHPQGRVQMQAAEAVAAAAYQQGEPADADCQSAAGRAALVRQLVWLAGDPAAWGGRRQRSAVGLWGERCGPDSKARGAAALLVALLGSAAAATAAARHCRRWGRSLRVACEAVGLMADLAAVAAWEVPVNRRHSTVAPAWLRLPA